MFGLSSTGLIPKLGMAVMVNETEALLGAHQYSILVGAPVDHGLELTGDADD
jgi:hypothetical protein